MRFDCAFLFQFNLPKFPNETGRAMASNEVYHWQGVPIDIIYLYDLLFTEFMVHWITVDMISDHAWNLCMVC